MFWQRPLGQGLLAYIEGMIADGEPIPEETEHAQAIVIKVAA